MDSPVAAIQELDAARCPSESKHSAKPHCMECGGRTKWRRRFGSWRRCTPAAHGRLIQPKRCRRFSQSGVAARRLALPPHSTETRVHRILTGYQTCGVRLTHVYKAL